MRFAVLLGALAVLGAACLGPGQFDPTGRAPIGNLEVIADAAGGIRVAGWALDPETSAPIAVKVGVRGVVHEVRADLLRPDVGAVYPAQGSSHGFEHTYGPLGPGAYDICVWAENQVGAGDDRLLGCRNGVAVGSADPVGSLETVTSLAPRQVTVAGWAFDPSSTDPVDVVVAVDGAFAARNAANGSRPDVAAAYGRPAAAGFRFDLSVAPGRHQVCVGVFNVGFGSDRLLGCSSVSVAESTEDRRPTGRLTSVTPLGSGRVSVTGVAADPDGATGLTVRLDVDPGTPAARSVTVPVLAGAFATTLDGLADGLHSLCPTALDLDGGFGVRGNRALVCGGAVLGAVAVGTAGAPAAAAVAVAPPPSSPLREAERDAGVSVVLRDGSTMWFFGDTSERDRVGNLEYFVNNTAAWAAPGAPTVTRDGVDGTRPWQFASPPSDWCAGRAYPKSALWPESAVAIPQPNGTDRVVVFMSKVCIGDAFLEIEARGMAVAELTYNPAAPPVDQRIVGTVTQADLATATKPWGRGAVLGPGNSYLYLYECGVFDGDDDTCHAARVPPAGITDRAQWRYWDGGDWSQDASWEVAESVAAPVVMPPRPDAFSHPVSAFTLTRDAAHGAYLMAYSPWPGFVDRVHVRVATTPVGPWTPPVEVMLPGCCETLDGVSYWCYAGTAQPELSGPGLLGVGYFDQLVSVGPSRGQYLTVTVPFSVVLTPAP